MSVAQLPSELSCLARCIGPAQFARYLVRMFGAAPAILRSRSLAAADGRMRGTVRFRTWGAPIAIDCRKVDAALPSDPTHAFSMARELYGRDVYLRAFRRFNAAGKTVLDLGANRGFFSALACAALSPRKVIAIEPQEFYGSVFKALTAPYAAVTEVVLRHGLAGGRPAQPLATEGEPAIVDLNHLLAGEGMIALAKIDIEGAEEALFADDTAWLDRVERVAMETHPAMCDISGVYDALEAHGFTVRPSDQYGRPSAMESALFFYAAKDPHWLRD
jgi:hypothetical protein